MRFPGPAALAISLILVGGCATFQAQEPPAPPEPPKEISAPVGKNWKVVEEPPALTNERNERLPFQTEQSVQPEGVRRPAAPSEKERKIETTR